MFRVHYEVQHQTNGYCVSDLYNRLLWYTAVDILLQNSIHVSDIWTNPVDCHDVARGGTIEAATEDFGVYNAFIIARNRIHNNDANQIGQDLKLRVWDEPVGAPISHFLTHVGSGECASGDRGNWRLQDTFANCARLCAITPFCQCMTYSSTGEGVCVLTITSSSDVTVAPRLLPNSNKHVYTYNGRRNVTLTRGTTIPILRDSSCKNLFAELDKTELLVKTNRGACRYTRGFWSRNIDLFAGESVVVVDATGNPVLVDQLYDVREYIGRPITFSRQQTQMVLPVVEPRLCSELLPLPLRDLVVRVNADRTCQYSGNAKRWETDTIVNSRDGIQVYMDGLDEYTASPVEWSKM